MSEPKVYSTDIPPLQFAKTFLGVGGLTWAVTEHGNGQFMLVVYEGQHGECWNMDRSQMADLWEMIGEALHHD